MRNSLYIILAALAAFLVGCIEDGIDTSPAAQPVFSVDTLNIGTVYTDQLTVTNRMTVYNRNSKGINIASIAMSGDDASYFRLNVDGMSGRVFSDIEVRANDSIFVFVEAFLPENGQDEPRGYEASIDFVVNGVQSSVVVAATGQDIVLLRGEVIAEDRTLPAGKPYSVTDSLVVAEGATLTIEAGARLLFHDKSKFVVRGRLLCEGTAEAPILITGDRTGEVLPGVSFDIVSRQWQGLHFAPESTGSRLAFTEVSNTVWGTTVEGGLEISATQLTLENCKLRNAAEHALACANSRVEAYGCEFAEAGAGLVMLIGGDYRFDQCTAANNYLFSAISGAAWTFADTASPAFEGEYLPTKAYITNSITYGLGSDATPGDLTGFEVKFERCLFKSAGTDDDNFVDCLWDQDPLFYTVRGEYVFDYRIKPESPAIGAANPALSEHRLATDYYGATRGLDLGAYVFVGE